MDTSYEYHKVIIVGAGIAGIGAADVFSRNGMKDFVILESSDRIGGRIWSIDLDTHMGHKVELGANWIHGIDLNPIYVIARDNNLLSTQYSGRHLGKKIIFAQENGDGVHPRLIQEVDIQYGQLMSEAEDFYKMQIPTPLDDDSVGAFIEREYDERMAGRFSGNPGMVEELELRKKIFIQRMTVESVIVGANSLYQVALSESGCFEDLPGVHYVIPSGFESVVEILRSSFDKEKIKLMNQVQSVQWDFNDINQSNESPRVKVECLNGRKYSADSILITIPLGCLKKYASRIFDPPLPSFKTNAIERIGMGTVNKVILEFDDQIFPNEVFRLECIWDRTNFENESMEERWFKKIASFEAVSDCVIMGWISGCESEYMETLSDEVVGRKCSELLKNFLYKIKPSFPNLKRVTRSKWKSNPHSLGAYCHIPIGCTAEEILNLAKPIPDKTKHNVLYFAGEATHPTFYSSSHGALLTGRAEAQSIIQELIH